MPAVSTGSPAISTIEGVLARLDDIVGSGYQERSRAAYFAAVYRSVTRSVQAGIASGSFQDGPRMERFDVIFASRYFDAYNGFLAGRPVSRCWMLSFQAASRWPPLILQHLLLGMNAHINMDLGIAAAEVAPGRQLAGLEHDFNVINGILGAMVAKVRSEVERVSPWIRLLDRYGSPAEGVFINFALDKARANAWSVATRLAAMTPQQRIVELDVLDSWVTILGNTVLHPVGFLVNAGIGVVRARESNDIRRVLTVLSQT
jgi:Family of unknown function (DUF5995)